MENKENKDIFNLAADTIMKWYEQTRNNIVKVSSHHDVELMGILLAAESQTSGALTTLESNHILSTHALLRTLVEIHIVLKWVSNVPENDEKAKFGEVYKRLRRWDYTRLDNDRKLFENIPRTSEIESALEKVNKDIKRLEEGGIKALPNCRQLYESLGTEWMEVYAKFYMKYSRAVHINRNVTRKLVREQYETRERKAVVYNNDIEPDGDELITIASISSDINKAIRDFYGWQSDAMQNEYEYLKSELVKK